MARIGQEAFKNSDIYIIDAPAREKSFVRVMAMMAVPKDGDIYDVSPKNGIKPMAFNKHEAIPGCIGFIDFPNSRIDEATETIIFAIKNQGAVSNSGNADTYGLFVGGVLFRGPYSTENVEGGIRGILTVEITPIIYDAYLGMLEISFPEPGLPVWPIDGELVMDYEFDWSGGMNIEKIDALEYGHFDTDETVSVKEASYQICDWRKLANATGMSLNIDVSNHLLNTTLMMGVITAGKPSETEPMYWLIEYNTPYTGIQAIARIYLNLHEVNYKQLGKYYLNRGQGHQGLYFRDGAVSATFNGDGTSGTLTFLPPTGASSQQFWSILPTDAGISYVGQFSTRAILEDGAPLWHNIELSYSSPNWTASFLTDIMASDTVVADIKITGIVLTKTIEVVNNVVTSIDHDTYMNTMDVYDIIDSVENEYSLWWDYSLLSWATDMGDTGETSAVVSLYSNIISYDSADFSLEDGATDIFQIDDTIYPERAYYFRLKGTLKDMVCSSDTQLVEIEQSDIFLASSEDPQNRYGIYAMSNYSVDSAGNQNRHVLGDLSGYTRYCGIYGRNWQCLPADTYAGELTLYPNDTNISLYYPPYAAQQLLSRANGGYTNNIEYLLTPNTITFDLSQQTMGEGNDPRDYASVVIGSGGNTLTLSYAIHGTVGNGYAVNFIIGTGEGVYIAEPFDGEVSIYLPAAGSTYAEISGALATSAVVHNLTSVVSGSGLVTTSTTYTLGGGGNDMVVDNSSAERSPLEIYMHPGFIFNSSSRKYPVNMVGIYAIFLSGNYASTDGKIDVLPIESDEGIELYTSIYSGNDLSRYTLVEDIFPSTTKYTDMSLQALYAKVDVPVDAEPAGAVTLQSKISGWPGNAIEFSYAYVAFTDWKYGVGNNYYYAEDVSRKVIIVHIKLGETYPYDPYALPVEDLLTSILASDLVTATCPISGNMKLGPDTYTLSGGGGGTSLFIHSKGYLVGLNSPHNTGTYNISRIYREDVRWMFTGEVVDLLAYKLDNTPLGYLNKDSQTSPYEWELSISKNFGGISALIDMRLSYGMLNYIGVGDREIEISDITYEQGQGPSPQPQGGGETEGTEVATTEAMTTESITTEPTTSEISTTLPPILPPTPHDVGDAGIVTFTTNDAGNKVIFELLAVNESIACGINDIFFSSLSQSNSINKSMVYYGRFQSRITVQLPEISNWGASLTPYYVVRLIYGNQSRQ